MKKVFIAASESLVAAMGFLLPKAGFPFDRVDHIGNADLVIVDLGFHDQRTNVLEEATEKDVPCLVLGSGQKHMNAADQRGAAFFETCGFDTENFLGVVKEVFELDELLHHQQAA